MTCFFKYLWNNCLSHVLFRITFKYFLVELPGNNKTWERNYYLINSYHLILCNMKSITRQSTWLPSVSIFVFFLSSFQRDGLSFVISGSSHFSFSAVLGLTFFFLFLFLFMLPTSYYSSSIHLVRGRRQPLFFIFDIRLLSVPFSWKPMLLPSWIGMVRARREHFFLHISFIHGQYGSAIRSKSLARRRSRNVTDLTSR